MNKMFGYFLTCIGLGIVFFALIAMFKVFVDGAAPAMIVKSLDFNIDSQYGPLGMSNAALVPIVNMALHAMFMFFAAMCGGKIANAGLKLVKIHAIAEALKEATLKDIREL